MKNLDKWDKLILTIGGGLSILLFVECILICIGGYRYADDEEYFFCFFSFAFGATILYFAIKQIYIISRKSTVALVISIVVAAALLYLLCGLWVGYVEIYW